MESRSERIPLATYRLQLHRGFTFLDAAAEISYLSRLGITDVYASPCLAARPGSSHGYDICDHSRLNPELGGEAGFDTLAAELSDRGMGLVLDFVPNHMAADARANAWWRDVLEKGLRSRFAGFFDIDWRPLKPELRGKLLLPILADRYGEVLERGELTLAIGEDGAWVLRYFDHELPIDPATAREALGQDPDAGRTVGALNGVPGRPESFDRLHDLLEVQAYRLAYWRTASHEINYRRFFDINELAALRMEDPAVFAATHSRVLRLVRERKVTGLRLDHIDGLFDPKDYLRRLRDAAGPLYVIVEKILTGGERLRSDWVVHGTTGYDFLNDLNGLFVDSHRARRLRKVYERFTGRSAPFPIVAYVGRKLIIETTMASELNVLAHALNRVSERDRQSRDFTLQSLRDAATEVVACFPVYRTYIDASGWNDSDRATLELAIARAMRRNPAMEPSIFEFLRGVLLPGSSGGLDPSELERRREVAMKFQQYTGPVTAKGLEDTAFYRANSLVSLNEVGGDPQRFGRSATEFHESNRHRREHWPFTMLATSTHDTKRGEDVRARLNVLSEIPDEWRKALSTWSRINAASRSKINGESAPDRNDEYLFYQTLLGTWPPAASGPDAVLIRRLGPYMIKAAKEAKLHTSWVSDNKAYDDALVGFVEKSLTGRPAAKFLAAFLPFQRRVARLGMVNSLSQLVLKLISPGVPDFYQGSELWDLSLVDPDNRGPVNFALRSRLLEEIEPLLDEQALDRRQAAVQRMLERWEDGQVKLYLTAAGLRLRQRQPRLFLEGDYLPLEARDERANHVIAFARRDGDDWGLVIAPRLFHSLTAPEHPLPLGHRSWGDTHLVVPEALAHRRIRNLFTGEVLDTGVGTIAIADALRTCPVALLIPAR